MANEPAKKFREKGEEIRTHIEETAELFGRRLQEEAEGARVRIREGIESSLAESSRRERRRGLPPTGRPPSGRPPSLDRK